MSLGTGETPVSQYKAYENEHGIACLAPYVRVYDMSGGSTREVGAIVKGERLGMDDVLQLDPEALAAEGVEIPSPIIGAIHAAAAERAAPNVVSMEEFRHAA